jgi:Domain of unknown function (DUF1924)
MEIFGMKQLCMVAGLIGGLLTVSAASASPATDDLFARYKSEGASSFSAEQGNKDWHRDGQVKDGKKMSCTTCHGDDLSKNGKHYKTGKLIKPMAPSANPERFTDARKIEKWFRRNCNAAWGRECTAQEKGDVLKFLLSK